MSDRETKFTSDKIKVFISYSRNEAEAVESLFQELSKDEDLEVFLDRYHIEPGEDWEKRLGDLIRSADAIVFALRLQTQSNPECNEGCQRDC